jgi:hypothetical protein
MRKTISALCLALLLAGCADFVLVPAQKPVKVARSELIVTPSRAWNRVAAFAGKNAESWTLDGQSLNDLTFYGGIADGKTLFREFDKRDRPLPRFSATMLAPDIAQLFEGSYRVATGTSLFTIGRMEPATLAGRPGFRFAYNFTLQGEEVRRSGEATGAVIDGRLYMITFEAPTLHYFTSGLSGYRAVAGSAALATGGKVRLFD